MTRSQAARNLVQGHTVSVSLLSDSDDDHAHEATSLPSVHVHLRVHDPEPASEEQLRNQLLEQQQLCEVLQTRSVILHGKCWSTCLIPLQPSELPTGCEQCLNADP